jgi:hypothetical protein
MTNYTMKNRHDYHDPEDESCPSTDRMDRLIDRADFLRDELRDRQVEESMTNRPQDGRICQCEDAPCCGHYAVG